MRKRIVSLLMVCVLLITMIAMAHVDAAVFSEPDMLTVYFTDTLGWDEISVAYWDSMDTNGSSAMTPAYFNDNARQVYRAQVPKNTVGITFGGSGVYKTVNIMDQIADGVLWYPTGETDSERYLVERVSTAPQIKGYTLGLKDEIAVNFYAYIEKGIYGDISATYSFGTGDYADINRNLSATITEISEPDLYNGATYRFTCMVSARSMTDDVVLSVKSDGTEILSDTQSIIGYSAKLVELYSDYRPLVCAMLDFGTACQSYFGYETDDLASGHYASFKGDWNPSYADILDDTTDFSALIPDIFGYVYNGAIFSVTSKTKIRLFFVRDDAVAEGTTIMIGDSVYTPYRDSSTGKYCIDIKDISAVNIFNEYEVSFIKGDQTAVIRYNPANYYNAAMNGSDPAFKAVMQKQYVYFTEVNKSLQNNIKISPEIDIDCHSFFNTSNGFNNRDFSIIDDNLYMIVNWKLYKVNIADADNPITEGCISLNDLKVSYKLPGTGVYPLNVTGMVEFDNKLIITCRMAISSMSSRLTDEQVVGSIIVLDLDRFELMQTIKLTNRQMCSSPALYQDVLITGFVQGGYGAYKITDSGLTELCSYQKTGSDDISELEFQGCTVIDSTVVFALYKYGMRSYHISYDGEYDFSMTQDKEVWFKNVSDFNYKKIRSNFVFTVDALDSKLYFPLSTVKGIPQDKRHVGVLMTDVDDLSSYSVFEVPDKVLPNAPYDNGTDPQPTFIEAEDNLVFINLGNKGIGCYYRNGDDLIYKGRFGETENAETEKVKIVDGRIYAIYRVVDGSRNLLFKGWDISRMSCLLN